MAVRACHALASSVERSPMRRFPTWILAAVASIWAASAGTAAGPAKGQTRLADGFDYPVGKPDAEGYYKARGFRVGGHPGEDWNGAGGGNSDIGDAVYTMGHGIVVLARDVRKGWGNAVIVRHAYREGAEVKTVDSLYAHLQRITVREGQSVTRGQQVGTIGTNRGMYEAHLHFEVRKNIAIGMARSEFSKDFTNYFDPTKFIKEHRVLKGGGRSYPIELNTFVQRNTYGAPSVEGGSASSTASGSARGSTASIGDFGGKKQFKFTFARYSDIDPNQTRYYRSTRGE